MHRPGSCQQQSQHTSQVHTAQKVKLYTSSKRCNKSYVKCIPLFCVHQCCGHPFLSTPPTFSLPVCRAVPSQQQRSSPRAMKNQFTLSPQSVSLLEAPTQTECSGEHLFFSFKPHPLIYYISIVILLSPLSPLSSFPSFLLSYNPPLSDLFFS